MRVHTLYYTHIHTTKTGLARSKTDINVQYFDK